MFEYFKIVLKNSWFQNLILVFKIVWKTFGDLKIFENLRKYDFRQNLILRKFLNFKSFEQL